MHLKIIFIVFLPLCFAGVLDNGLVPVDSVLFQLVGQHSFDGLALKAFRNLLNSVSDSIGLEGKRGGGDVRKSRIGEEEQQMEAFRTNQSNYDKDASLTRVHQDDSPKMVSRVISNIIMLTKCQKRDF